MKKFTLITICCVFLTACISIPPGLQTENVDIQALTQINAEDYTCGCKKVRLGGQIISAVALKKQTKLEILSFPISKYSAKPNLEKQSDGRFIAYLEGFVDPKVLQDQYITVVGKLILQEKGNIDQAEYTYPVVQVENYKRWNVSLEYYDPNDWEGSPLFRRSMFNIYADSI